MKTLSYLVAVAALVLVVGGVAFSMIHAVERLGPAREKAFLQAES